MGGREGPPSGTVPGQSTAPRFSIRDGGCVVSRSSRGIHRSWKSRRSPLRAAGLSGGAASVPFPARQPAVCPPSGRIFAEGRQSWVFFLPNEVRRRALLRGARASGAGRRRPPPSRLFISGGGGPRRRPSRQIGGYLVDPASSHMLVSKTKPCMSEYKRLCTVKLRMAH